MLRVHLEATCLKQTHALTSNAHNEGCFCVRLFKMQGQMLLCSKRVSLRKPLKQKGVMEMRSPHPPPACQIVKKCSVSYSARSIGNESDIYARTAHVHAPPPSLSVQG